MRLLLTAIATLIFASCNGIHSELTLEQKAARLLITGFRGTSFDEQSKIVEDIKSGVAGVIIFETNIESSKEVESPRENLRTFISDLKGVRSEPLFVAIDQEGGYVNRLKSKYGFKDMPSQQSVAEKNDDEYVIEVAHTIASELSYLGINLNFSPCVDVNINPKCPVIGRFKRSFSQDESTVSKLAKIYIEEHHKQGVLTSLKHFPGHGNSLKDSHLGVTDITDTWQKDSELSPYIDLIKSEQCDMVMVSHLFNREIDSRYPASLSKSAIDSLLRGVLNWKGVVITDDMQMKAIVDNYGFKESIILAINAGVDLFIDGNDNQDDLSVRERFVEVVVEGVQSGEISIKRLDKSIRRINRLMNRLP